MNQSHLRFGARTQSALLVLGFLAFASPVLGYAQSVALRDSSGVQIVENSSRRSLPIVFELGEPVLDIGGTEHDADEEFNHNQGYLRALRLSDGRIAVIDVWRIHLFGKFGKRERIVGRKGQGPEEFSYLNAICRTRADTIVVGDAQNRRLTVLDSQGRFGGTFAEGANGSPSFDSCFNDGSILLRVPVQNRSIGDGPLQRLTRVRTDGTIVNEVGIFRASLPNLVTQSGVTAVASGELLYYGDGKTSEIRVYAATGKLLRLIRTNDEPDMIREAEAEERLSKTIPTTITGAQRTIQMERLRKLPRPSTWPTFGELIVGADGRLWLQDYSRDGERAAWTVFEPSGRAIGKLVLSPARIGDGPIQVLGFGSNEILLRRFDQDRASHITAYPLVRVDNK